MEIAIIVFFFGAFIALGVLGIAIFIFWRLVKKKQNNRNNFVDPGHYSGVPITNISENANDTDDYAPIYFAANEFTAEQKVETAADASLGVTEAEKATNENVNYSEASEGAGSAVSYSYSESNYSDSSSSSSYDSSSSYSDSSSSSSDSGSSSSSSD